MNIRIQQQIHRLGGRTTAGPEACLREVLQHTVFPHPLYPKSYADNFFGLDEFYRQHRELYARSPDDFYAALLHHFFSDHQLPYGQDFFRNFLFTPFTAGTPDYGELDGLVSPEELRTIVAGEPLEFMCIAYSYGFPDHYFVCLHDPTPENPSVYGTDHEAFFQEITPVGTLEDFFSRYLTPEEFLSIVRHQLERTYAEQ
ncbi:hypothetical protein [Hymenobacter guriensis]|uniref:SMI1/KNR4 family protein n=1 Tax=Hymenobacter guriensis TaxID=2793065 RepID=A0ABS0L0H3_9BACT|nr:hypothetical protein [Hymenobacter guriensis]MBG8553485.1 hypothetical protein [Hymenobacter guriensis]